MILLKSRIKSELSCDRIMFKTVCGNDETCDSIHRQLTLNDPWCYNDMMSQVLDSLFYDQTIEQGPPITVMVINYLCPSSNIYTSWFPSQHNLTS